MGVLILLVTVCGFILPGACIQAAKPTPPTLDEVRSTMGIPSESTALRGQKDNVGFSSTAEQMAEVWRLSDMPPAPDILGKAPSSPVVGVICPHDDYVYAGRVYRAVLPQVKARRIIVVGVFHKWRAFGAHDALVFGPYKAWRSPDGDVPVSSLREDLLKTLPAGDWIQDAAMQDSEHSVEAIVYWLKHIHPDLEIVPFLVPTMNFDRMRRLADDTADAIKTVCAQRGWVLGKDVAVVISSDATHYGPDFDYEPYGAGGIAAYEKAVGADEALLKGPLAGRIDIAKVREVFDTFCDPKNPGTYRRTWCGRYSVPFGLLLMDRLARDGAAGARGALEGHPIAYATSVGWPELPAKTPGLGKTAPDSLYHFVGYPAAAYTVEKSAPTK